MKNVKDLLYPEPTPYNTGHLEVSHQHTIYFEEYGNPDGIPVTLCHGGPGSNSKPKHARMHNPKHFRIILWDQRGCGKSTPYAETEHNTTFHTVSDMEALRIHLDINNWQVVGGSWGSTVALCYAIAHPQRVQKLVIWGVFTSDEWMLKWFGEDGLGTIFPEAYAKLQTALPANNEEERTALRHKLLQGTREEQLQASAYSEFEGAGMAFFPEKEEPVELTPEEQKAEEDSDICYAKIFAHYESNGCFLPEGYILENAHKLKDIEGHIIHGRYDMCTPVKAAYQLSQAWPEAEFTIVHEASHRTEPPLLEAVMNALKPKS